MKAHEYLKYAEDCERMAKQMPAHAAALHQMAKAWRMLAAEADRMEQKPKP